MQMVFLRSLVVLGVCGVCPATCGVQAAGAGGEGVDGHVLALWLFDETAYPNVTLTDAGPLHADLRIETGRERPLPASMRDGRRGLVPGKFGNALALPIEDRIGVVWATSRFPLYDASGHPERGAAKPQWHVFTLPKPTPQEFPPIDCGGQVYRFKGAKYAHAPDVYLAFPWRYVGKDNIRPGSFLMVSRNGDNWTRYEPPYYFPSGWQFNGRKVLEGLSEQGLMRRGDELWQYMTVRFTEHGGALYGGKEHDGSGYDRLVRLTQRLDGFVSLDLNKSGAWAETRPLVFGGSRLEINANVPGELRASLLDADGKPLPGLDAAACLPIRGDSVRHIVRWKDSPDLKRHVGSVVRLRLEGRDAQVYAIQFK